MNKKLLAKVREKFEQALKAKTGWGRVELLAAYDQAVTEAVLELLDEE